MSVFKLCVGSLTDIGKLIKIGGVKDVSYGSLQARGQLMSEIVDQGGLAIVQLSRQSLEFSLEFRERAFPLIESSIYEYSYISTVRISIYL